MIRVIRGAYIALYYNCLDCGAPKELSQEKKCPACLEKDAGYFWQLLQWLKPQEVKQ